MAFSKASREAAIHENLWLEGEEVVRSSTGDLPRTNEIEEGYLMVYVGTIEGKPYQDLLHRVKWCLLFGNLRAVTAFS